ncbi:hypothetical protein SOV_30790 [Sporomusa ovata DSM 2662]|uniref:Uncharacterized protein n=1 Tax=Sporomusa ovata TaxID=2378 RepID=A0A0U1L1N3_9FIRM|nr:DUF1657 domain-containing protein [Sporomusa ovata]EQB25037.1 hypothetical protein SOV_5c01830 [Sporomusa ovata DSM 2662]CQR73587.1 hypothetical protein SpAn4DRAFT_0049 [Sporomusa ovata]
MTIQQDLHKTLATAKSAQGSYAQFAQSMQDQTAKQMFQQMEQDMVRHIAKLNNRLGTVQESYSN